MVLVRGPVGNHRFQVGRSVVGSGRSGVDYVLGPVERIYMLKPDDCVVVFYFGVGR